MHGLPLIAVTGIMTMAEIGWLTTAEVAALLTGRGVVDRSGGPVKPRTVQKWCELGVLPAQRVGSKYRGQWLIEEATVAAFTPPTQGRPRKGKA